MAQLDRAAHYKRAVALRERLRFLRIALVRAERHYWATASNNVRKRWNALAAMYQRAYTAQYWTLAALSVVSHRDGR